MTKIITILFLISSLCSSVNAVEPATDYREERKNPDFYRILPAENVSFFETEFNREDESHTTLSQEDECVTRDSSLSAIDPNTIVNIGRQIWKIIEAGQPKVTVKSEAAHALPKGVRCWTDLAGWQVPTVKHFNVEYKNAMGITVAEYSYKVSYIYGGSLNGRGRYLAGIRVLPTKLKVLWGFTFDSVGKVPNVVNTGTVEPVAGAEVEVHWSIKSPITDVQQSQTYFVTGEGDFTDLNQSQN